MIPPKTENHSKEYLMTQEGKQMEQFFPKEEKQSPKNIIDTAQNGTIFISGLF